VRIGALLLAAALAFSYCSVSGGIAPAPPASARDVQDLVFLSDARPILLRLHIYVDGRPFRDVWEDYIRLLFDYLDRDGNGILTKSEAEHAPAAAQLLQMMRGGILSDPMKTVSFGELDIDPLDGFVTFQEFAGYYRRSGAGPLQVADGPAIERSEALTRALFKHLDVNRDGKLSQAEVLAAESALRRFDLDDDEMISEEELLPASMATPFPQPAGQARGQPPGHVASFHVVDRDRAPAGLAQRLIQKYDKDKKGSLSRAEIGLGKALFDRLDADHDGQLDETELGKFAGQPPDIEVTVRTGEPTPGQRSVEVYHSRQRAKPPAPTICAVGNETLVITLADEQIGVVAPPERPDPLPPFFRSIRQFYVQQFQAADTEKKGYVDRTKAMNPQFRFLLALFPVADRDGDGKLTQRELHAFLDLQEKAALCATGLELTTSGRGLFEILDANRDRRLGQRELRSAWSRLAIWDRNGDGLIAPTELPQQFQLVLGRGQPYRRAGRLADIASTNAASVKGPLWFRKMDRNGDGDVSPREFLGTPEDFRRIDTNGDGLIDPQEAEAADRWFAKRTPSRR
jgi:Ca2+-binding EF-hand superfamily protein